MPSWFPDAMRQFGQTFAVQQSKRHFADYDPDHAIRKSEVVADIQSARTAIDDFLATPASARRDFALHVLMSHSEDDVTGRWPRLQQLR